jgi:hypothetical protein
LHQVVEVKRRFAEQTFAILLFEREQGALDGADRRDGDIAVLGGELFRVLSGVLHHRTQVF